uniref:Uncharacterized protein n=1 Tax=viral metagenome TaxID=1070528 RepID=A0A6C0EFJ2_9ZZZZ
MVFIFNLIYYYILSITLSELNFKYICNIFKYV